MRIFVPNKLQRPCWTVTAFLVAFTLVGCRTSEGPEGIYELQSTVDGKALKGYLEIKPKGELWVHWLLPDGLFQVSSGFLETPESQRKVVTTATAPQHFRGLWEQAADNQVALDFNGARLHCTKPQRGLECSFGESPQVLLQVSEDALPGWAKATVPPRSAPVGARPLGDWNDGELLSVRVYTETSGASNERLAVRADLAPKRPEGVVLVPRHVALVLGHSSKQSLVSAWPLAEFNFTNEIGCGTLRAGGKISRVPVAFVTAPIGTRVRLVALHYGCEGCGECTKDIETKALGWHQEKE